MILSSRGNEIEAITAEDMMSLAAALPVCTKHQIGLLCPKCQQTFHGRNGSGDREWVIVCACRELRADMGGGRA